MALQDLGASVSAYASHLFVADEYADAAFGKTQRDFARVQDADVPGFALTPARTRSCHAAQCVHCRGQITRFRCLVVPLAAGEAADQSPPCTNDMLHTCLKGKDVFLHCAWPLSILTDWERRSIKIIKQSRQAWQQRSYVADFANAW